MKATGVYRKPVYYALDSGSAATFLHIVGLVDYQHRARLTLVPGHVLPQVVADSVRAPAGPPEQVLHPVRGRAPGTLGDRLAGLACLGQRIESTASGKRQRIIW
jgi:hypothetical protein